MFLIQEFLGRFHRPEVTVRQDGRVIARKTLPWPASPGRVFRVPSDVLDDADPRGGPVTVSVRG